MFSDQNLSELLAAVHEDRDVSALVLECLLSFQRYHETIYSMEINMKIYNYASTSITEFQDRATELDKHRTNNHNCVLDSINILNRIAVQYDVSPIYTGIVSEDHPYRREVADAVLAYVESVILARR